MPWFGSMAQSGPVDIPWIFSPTVFFFVIAHDDETLLYVPCSFVPIVPRSNEVEQNVVHACVIQVEDIGIFTFV